MNTWHGTPLKTLGKKIQNAMYGIGNTQKNFFMADYLLYPNGYTMEHMVEDYMLENLAGDAYRVYLGGEISLLRDLGFALDLSHCSGCGATQNLNYLSPRTARAVCDKCAAPYIDRLYKLPVNLGVTGRFLDSVCAQLGVNIPHMRKMLKLD